MPEFFLAAATTTTDRQGRLTGEPPREWPATCRRPGVVGAAAAAPRGARKGRSHARLVLHGRGRTGLGGAPPAAPGGRGGLPLPRLAQGPAPVRLDGPTPRID